MDESGAFDLNSPTNWFLFMKRLFTEDFMPHGHCYFWRSDVLWLHVLSDIGIAISYFAIPLILFYFIRKRPDLPFHRIFLMFAAFILLCGTTHIISAVSTWIPIYRFEGFIKMITAIVSMLTAVMLVPIMPKVVAFPTMEVMLKQLSDKKNKLESINKDLERFNKATMGREDRIIELKHEVNQLAIEAGKNPPYKLVE